MDILVQIFGWTITIVISLFVIVSIVLFIKDGILARREGTGRKKYIQLCLSLVWRSSLWWY
ncbi:MAG: hypothetical protein K2M78_09580 [Lachnospiraceae bacterium]|nr:hypothetical protein [Lachnospiraceae bacterium]